MYTNANFWRDMAILGGSLLMAGISALFLGDETKNGGASGRW